MDDRRKYKGHDFLLFGTSRSVHAFDYLVSQTLCVYSECWKRLSCS